MTPRSPFYRYSVTTLTIALASAQQDTCIGHTAMVRVGRCQPKTNSQKRTPRTCEGVSP